MANQLPDQKSFQSLLWKAVMLPLVLALLLAALFFWQVRRLQQSDLLVDHSNSVISQALLLEKLVMDAQTSVRGYLLTFDPDYLKPYQKSVTRLPQEFDLLKKELPRGTSQGEGASVLKIKVDNWLTYTISLLHERIRRQTTAKFNPSRHGEDLMNSIRAEFNQFTEKETEIRDARVQAAKHATNVALLNAFGLCFVIGLTLAFSTRRLLLAISHSYGNAFHSLEKTTHELEGALGMRDEFLSIASHELKTPITSLKLYLQMTQKGMISGENSLPDPVRLKKAVDASLKQVSRLEILVEDLLDISRIQAGKLKLNFENMDLSQLLFDIADHCEDELAKVKCRLEKNIERNVQVECDSFRVEQVILNLITNAIKYAPGKPVVLSLTSQGENVRIEVKDQGIGIAEEMQYLVFERFERVTSAQNISGLGLGLYIVKKIITAHHGEVGVESVLGKGSTFYVTLPKKQMVSSLVAAAERV